MTDNIDSKAIGSKTADQINTLDNIAINVSLKSNEEIDRLIKETEETLTVLMGELKRRQEDEMHKDIDRLDEYMEEADTGFKNLRKFIAMALAELRG